MTHKLSIRYIRFTSTYDGSRRFDFSVSGGAGPTFTTCMEIAGAFFAGPNRIQVQEGAGICYAKLKDLVEAVPLTELPPEVQVTASDLTRYRTIPHVRGKHPPY